MSAVETKLKRRVEIELVLVLEPARGQVGRRLVVVLVGVLERAAHRRPGRHRAGLRRVALHHAEGEAEREGGVGVSVVASDANAGLGDLRVGLPQRLVDFLFVLLANGPRRPDPQQGELDHRVVRRVDGLRAAVGQLAFARPRLSASCRGSIRRPGRAAICRASTFDNESLVGAQLRDEHAKAVGQLDGLQVVVDRGCRKRAIAPVTRGSLR